MKEDRLRKDTDDIDNLEDIIDAHDEHTSHFTQDIDAYEEDLEIPEDIDVDEALTFPHPKHKKTQDIDLMDTPHKEEIEPQWGEDQQPSDYEDHYDDATDTYATDDLDEVVEDRVHHMGDVTPEEIEDEPTTEIMPDKFTPDE